jgi:hypothetical protein
VLWLGCGVDGGPAASSSRGLFLTGLSLLQEESCFSRFLPFFRGSLQIFLTKKILKIPG